MKKYISLFILLIWITFNVNAQIKSDEQEKVEQEGLVVTYMKSSFPINIAEYGQAVSYTYKGKQYPFGGFANHFTEIVSNNSSSIKEMKKFKIKKIGMITLGVSSFAFFGLTLANKIGNGEFNYFYTGAFVGAYMGHVVLKNSTGNNIINAMEYYNIEQSKMSMNLPTHLKLTYRF
jgi:hypothetical protein